jgi:putative addiction module component (TIGR02574 family)
MNATTENLLDAALALPDDERLQFAEALFVSFQPTDLPPFDESWRAIIQRRSEELKSGKVTPIPWAEVKRRAREKITRPIVALRSEW